MKLAFDRDSVRDKDVDGRLRVAVSHITREQIAPYYGAEIPGWQALGLNPDDVYNVYRPASELSRPETIASLNSVPLLSEHQPVDVDNHRPELIVGALGTDAVYAHPYLDNSLIVWTAQGISDIENGNTRELSAGYRYTPTLENGTFDGQEYQLVMKNIIFNHVALVAAGRAGPTVVVQDSAIQITIGKALNIMAKAKKAPSSMTLLAKVAFQALAPKMATDSVEGFKKLAETKLDHKVWVSTVKPALEKLKLAQDTSLADVKEVILALDEAAKEDKQAEDEDDDMDAMDDDPVMKMLKEKGLSEDEMKMVKDSMGVRGMQGANDADKDEEAKAKQAADEEAEAKAKADADEKAKQAADAEKDEDMKDKQAMDAAIKAAVDGAKVEAKATREAVQFVRPWVGELAMDCDSAEQVYRAAFKTLGMDKVIEGVDPSAFKAILSVAQKPNEQAQRQTSLALDAKPDDDFMSRFPNAGRIKAVR